MGMKEVRTRLAVLDEDRYERVSGPEDENGVWEMLGGRTSVVLQNVGKSVRCHVEMGPDGSVDVHVTHLGSTVNKFHLRGN